MSRTSKQASAAADPVPAPLDDGVAELPPHEMENARTRCKKWLHERMTAGLWYEGNKLLHEGLALGFTASCIQKCRRKLGIVGPYNLVKIGQVTRWRRPAE
jgi:hypothetical protein